MVSQRCKMMVKAGFKKLGLHYSTVALGEFIVEEDISLSQREELKIFLLKSRLELMDDKKSILVERVKNVIVEMVHYTDDLPKYKFSNFLSEKLNYNYTYLANIFTEMQGIPIEQYIINHKIEKVKELISYNELNLTEIAWKLHFCNVAHLSNQFKKVTGQTPSNFKACKRKKLSLLEDL